WLYFLNNARKLQEIPPNMDDIAEIKKAFYIANQANLTLDELEDQEKSEIFIQDQRGAITKAVKESLDQGRQEGSQQKAYEIAGRMLGAFDEETIARMTGLTLNDLRSLRD
ncbi:MAG: transposase, partial [Pseudanabaena sp. CAN_BIN31]|nr:transposase [Pseudanabaena sp. CAN_BIN31]